MLRLKLSLRFIIVYQLSFALKLAPHIPIHLGSLSHAVKYQMNYYKDKLEDGDVILTNHPQAGGSHLPGNFILSWVVRYEKNDYH